MPVLVPASLSSHWFFLLLYSLFPVSVICDLLARSQVRVSAEVTSIFTLPIYRSSIPAALGWRWKRSLRDSGHLSHCQPRWCSSCRFHCPPASGPG
jgi:hypothetical protein